MARGFKTGGRKAGTPNRRTAMISEALRQVRQEVRDAPDGPVLTPLEIIERAANRLYSAALFFGGQANFEMEKELLKAAAVIAEKATAYRHPKMPATIIAPNDIPPLRLLTTKQLERLALELRQDEGEVVDDGKPGDQETR